MPIEIKDCDGGMGTIVESRGIVKDQELVDSLKNHLAQDREKFKEYKYILFDHTAVTKMSISDETVELVAGLCADASKVNPDPVIAIVVYFSMAANIELINRISKMYEMFLNQAGWESLVFRTKMEAVRWIRKKVRDKFGIDDLTFD
jgi:hypothetical protein